MTWTHDKPGVGYWWYWYDMWELIDGVKPEAVYVAEDGRVWVPGESQGEAEDLEELIGPYHSWMPLEAPDPPKSPSAQRKEAKP